MRNVEELINRQLHRWNNIAETLHYLPGEQTGPGAAEDNVATPGGALHPVITISRELGSGGREIAVALCDALGYELFGTSFVDAVARDLRLQRELAVRLDERLASRLEGLVQSFLSQREVQREDYLGALTRVINTIAAQGAAVLLGRGAGIVLGHRAALNLRVIAPIEQRIARVMSYESVDARTARRMIDRIDGERNSFIASMLDGREDEAQLHYDLTINTARLDVPAATEIALGALKARGFDPKRIVVHATHAADRVE